MKYLILYLICIWNVFIKGIYVRILKMYIPS